MSIISDLFKRYESYDKKSVSQEKFVCPVDKFLTTIYKDLHNLNDDSSLIKNYPDIAETRSKTPSDSIEALPDGKTVVMKTNQIYNMIKDPSLNDRLNEVKDKLNTKLSDKIKSITPSDLDNYLVLTFHF